MHHVNKLGMLKGQGISKPKWYARIFWHYVHKNDDIEGFLYWDTGVFRRWIRCIRSGKNVLFFPRGHSKHHGSAPIAFRAWSRKAHSGRQGQSSHVLYSQVGFGSEDWGFESPSDTNICALSRSTEASKSFYRKEDL